MTKVALIVVSKAFRVYAVSIAFISSVNREGGVVWCCHGWHRVW